MLLLDVIAWFFVGYLLATVTEYLPRYERLYQDARREISCRKRELEELRQLVKEQALGPDRSENER